MTTTTIRTMDEENVLQMQAKLLQARDYLLELSTTHPSFDLTLIDLITITGEMLADTGSEIEEFNPYYTPRPSRPYKPAPVTSEDWEWADQVFANSPLLSTFVVDEVEFLPHLDRYIYADEFGHTVTIDADGTIDATAWVNAG